MERFQYQQQKRQRRWSATLQLGGSFQLSDEGLVTAPHADSSDRPNPQRARPASETTQSPSEAQFSWILTDGEEDIDI